MMFDYVITSDRILWYASRVYKVTLLEPCFIFEVTWKVYFFGLF